jgi:hypothetical protein
VPLGSWLAIRLPGGMDSFWICLAKQIIQRWQVDQSYPTQWLPLHCHQAIDSGLQRA